MTLILSVISSGNNTENESLEHEFNEGGGTIGRRMSNTWVLPDDNRHLSGSHATIEYEKENYFIVDTSTNGVFINGSSKPLGRGNRQRLEDDSQLIMGTFTISVVIKTVEEVIETAQTEDKSIQDSGELFADLVDDSMDDLDPLPLQEMPLIDSHDKKQSSIGTDDPFFDFDEFTTSDDASRFKEEQVIESNSPELGSFFKPAEIRSTPEESTSEIIPELTGIFKEDSKPPPRQNTQDNNEEVALNESKLSKESVIPNDWHALTSDEDSFDDLFEGISDPFKDESDPFALTEINDLSELRTPQQEEQGLPKNVVPPPREPVVNRTEEGGVKETQAAKLSTVEEEGNVGVTGNSISAFIKGLGVDESLFKTNLSEQDLYLAGKLFRMALQGSMEVLQSRAEIKNEMRMDMTTIQPIQNNPIKFAVNVDEALRKLFLHEDSSYMDPERAMAEAFDDIKSHQIAVISGVQASLVAVLKRFEPENLVKRLEKESPISANIPIHRKAKLWDKFETLYDTIESEAEDDFNRLFGQEFAKAYDEQVALLEKQRGE